jgi:hypothetical protein
MGRWSTAAHSPARIICVGCNRTIGYVDIHDHRCGCTPRVWNRQPDPPRWFEVAARDVPRTDWAEKHPEYHIYIRGDMLDDEPRREFKYRCKRCNRWRTWSESDLTTISDRPILAH